MKTGLLGHIILLLIDSILKEYSNIISTTSHYSNAIILIILLHNYYKNLFYTFIIKNFHASQYNRRMVYISDNGIFRQAGDGEYFHIVDGIPIFQSEPCTNAAVIPLDVDKQNAYCCLSEGAQNQMITYDSYGF